MKESDDLVNWTHERTVLVPNERDATDFYGMPVFRRGDLFFGLLQIYDAGRTNKVFSELTWSTNGIRWHRLPVGTQKTPISLGKEGAWDYGQIYTTDKPVMVGDEMWFYYAGNKTTHNVKGMPAIGLATTKKDRLFGARSKPDTLSRILTRPLQINGDLFVNASAKGEISVEIRSAIRDEPIEGWTASECTPFSGNELDAQICWGEKTLSDLKGEIVRLRFNLRDAVLYSFDIK